MTKQEIFETLKPSSLYVTGSRANPYIKNPRDTEYYAVFDSLEDLQKTNKIYNVHSITKDYVPKRFFIWNYLHHYLNVSDDYLGEKHTFIEMSFSELVAIADLMIKKYPNSEIKKYWYHVAMVKAIEKYGYDNIPENVAQQINDLHDLKISYSEFKLEEGELE